MLMRLFVIGLLFTFSANASQLTTAVEESENALIDMIEKEEAEKTKEAISLAADEFLNFMTMLHVATLKHKERPNMKFRSLITYKSAEERTSKVQDSMVHSADYFQTALDSTQDIENILMIEQVKASSGHQRALRLLAIQQAENMNITEKDESLLTELTQKAEEAYERAKTIHSDAASKLYYERNRCQLTSIPFICKQMDACQKRLTAAEELRDAAQKRFSEQKKEVQMERDLTINLQIRLEISTNKYQAAVVLKQLEDLAFQAKPLRELVDEFNRLSERLHSDSEKPSGKGSLARLTNLVREVVRNFLGTGSEPWMNLSKLNNEELLDHKR